MPKSYTGHWQQKRLLSLMKEPLQLFNNVFSVLCLVLQDKKSRGPSPDVIFAYPVKLKMAQERNIYC